MNANLYDNNKLTHWLAVDINSQVIAGSQSRVGCETAAVYVQDALLWDVEPATEAAYQHWLNDGPSSGLDFLGQCVVLRT